jgi:hypothetical protein
MSQKQALGWLSLASLLAVSGGVAFETGWLAFSEQNQQPDKSFLILSAENLNFGEAWEAERFNWTLKIRNQTHEEVAIRGFSYSCDCAEIEPRSLSIGGHSSKSVRLILNLTSRRKLLSESRDLEVLVQPQIVGYRNHPPWSIHGRVRTAIQFSDEAPDLGRHSEFAQPVPEKRVTVTSFVPLRSLTATSASESISVAVKKRNDSATQFDLLISAAKLPLGSFTSLINVVPTLSDGTRLPARKFSVTASIVNDFQASPPGALFGARMVGENGQQSLTVYSISRRAFWLKGIDVQAKNVAVARHPDFNKTGTELNLVVKQRISQIGEQKGQIILHLATDDGKEHHLPLPVSYFGLGDRSRLGKRDPVPDNDT